VLLYSSDLPLHYILLVGLHIFHLSYQRNPSLVVSQLYIILIGFGYLLLLLLFAFLFRKYKTISNSKYAYALSLCVYCTGWTFYGSIGKAAESGFGYLGVYLGPTLAAPLMFIVLSKTIKISKFLRISSLADFISSRYGKDAVLGKIVTLLCVMVAIPYISIQLKALNISYLVLRDYPISNNISYHTGIFNDPALYFGICCALISSILGIVKAAPTDGHRGVVSVIALESIFKLLSFLIGALTIIFIINNGLTDIFHKFETSGLGKPNFDLTLLKASGNQWFFIALISACAFYLLPRQFHMSVVENSDVKHVRFASWMVPLYFFLISIFVIPIALSGILKFGNAVLPDSFLLNILLLEGFNLIAIIVFTGGVAACTGMIISSLISLSIMLSNQIVLPLLLKMKSTVVKELEVQVLQYRRLMIFVVLLLSFLFYKFYAVNYSLVSIGLISFVGISQLMPAFLLGLYWKHANSTGVKSGLIVGIVIWAYTLPVSNLIEMGVLTSSLLEDGLFGLSFLKPHELFGIQSMDPISLSTFTSLTANILTTCIISLVSSTKPLEFSQADIFLQPDKYIDQNQSSLMQIEADFKKLLNILSSILGEDKLKKLLEKYKMKYGIKTFDDYADTQLINYMQNYLSGSLGSAATNVLLDNIVKLKPVQPDQLYKIVGQTNELFQYAQALEQKRDELKLMSEQLSDANNKLLYLDNLKNEFISNITHELRTPVTSIRSLAESLDEFEMAPEEQAKILSIIKSESERMANLINQVLDLRKLELVDSIQMETFSVRKLIISVIESQKSLLGNRGLLLPDRDIYLNSDSSKLHQVLINIISNAIKFTDSETGKIEIYLSKIKDGVFIEIKDNGQGIPVDEVPLVFDRFFQASNISKTHHKGTGLGLSISRDILQLLNGSLTLESEISRGSTFTIFINT